MRTVDGTFDVDGRSSRWVRDGTLRGHPLVLFAHGAGAPLTSPFMQQVAHALVAHDLCVARFHFPYMQMREETGRMRPPDRAPRLIATWAAMGSVAARWRGAGPRVAMGKSMGGRMASMYLAERKDAAVAAVYLGYPLHPAGKPDRLRKEHLGSVVVPQLFVQGTRDALCDLTLLGPVLQSVPTARLCLVDGGDHSLLTRRQETVGAETPWIQEVATFVHQAAAGL